MEKWKVAAIVCLLASLGLYGVIQARYPGGVGTLPPLPGQAPVPTGTPIPVMALVGKTPQAWNFPASQWTNTAKPITLQDTKGSVTLLEFWRTGCPHCRDAAPFMVGLQKKYGPQGLKIVTFQSPTSYDSVTDDENNWVTVKEFIKEYKINYPVAFDTGGKLFAAYKGTNYPTLLVLDRKGVVRLIQTGHTPEKAKALLAEIEKQLK